MSAATVNIKPDKATKHISHYYRSYTGSRYTQFSKKHALLVYPLALIMHWYTVFCFLQIGDPKCLDGQRADLVVCRPEAGGSCWLFPSQSLPCWRVESSVEVMMAGHWAWITSKPCGMHLRTFYNVFVFCSHTFNTPFEFLWQCFTKRPNQPLKCWDFRSFLNPAEGADDAVTCSLRCCDLGLNRLCNERLVPSSLVAKAAEIYVILFAQWKMENLGKWRDRKSVV